MRRSPRRDGLGAAAHPRPAPAHPSWPGEDPRHFRKHRVPERTREAADQAFRGARRDGPVARAARPGAAQPGTVGAQHHPQSFLALGHDRWSSQCDVNHGSRRHADCIFSIPHSDTFEVTGSPCQTGHRTRGETTSSPWPRSLRSWRSPSTPPVHSAGPGPSPSSASAAGSAWTRPTCARS